MFFLCVFLCLLIVHNYWPSIKAMCPNTHLCLYFCMVWLLKVHVALPKFNKIAYGRNSFTYYGSHLWNNLPNEFKQSVDYQTFVRMISKWEGPKCSCSLCAILTVIWCFDDVIIECYVYDWMLSYLYVTLVYTVILKWHSFLVFTF